MCIFLSSVFEAQRLTIRIFDVLYSGSGDTALQINVLGDLAIGQEPGFIDPIASNGQMRRLQPEQETLPMDRADWVGHLADFVAVFPWLDVHTI